MASANLFLLAAPRSGSTQLAAWMSTHPDISCTFVKEPNFFSSHEFPDDYIKKSHLNDIDPSKIKDVGSLVGKSYQFAVFKTEDQYRVLTEALTSQYRMDASTTYLHCPEAIKAILDYNPDANFIVLLRDPIARLISHYRLAIRTGRENRPLASCLKAEMSGDDPLAARFLLRQSLYFDALSRVISSVPSDKLKIILFEDLLSNPKRVLNQIGAFLGVDENSFELSVKQQNEGVAPRFPLLNRFIAITGIKTYLRSILPKVYKEKLKGLYFSEKKIEVDISELDACLSSVRGDVKNLLTIVPDIKNYWGSMDLL